MAMTVERQAGPSAAHRTTQATSWAVIVSGTFVTVAAGAWLARRHLEPAWGFGEPPFYERTVFPHAAAMTAIVALALLAIGPLLRASLPVLAFVIAGGVAFGPLSLLAAPIFTTPTSYETGTRTVEVALPWMIGMVVTVLLLSAAQHLNRGAPPAVPLGIGGLAIVGALMVLPLLAVPFLPGGESNFAYPTFFPIEEVVIVTGCAVLAGGLMIEGLLAVDRPHASGLRLAGTATALALGHWAYDRSGGAPIVPGWDYTESPHLIAAPTTILLISAATVGLLLHVTGVRAKFTPAHPGDLREDRQSAG